MSRTSPDESDDGSTDCSTADSFADHGIERGTDLVSGTHSRLGSAGIDFEPTGAFFDRLEEAFLWAYLGSTDDRTVPPHVEAAIDDAKALTAEEFAERAEADLRTDVIPTFYQHVAGFHCAYRERAEDPSDPGLPG